jgi:hypothetical protein
MANHSIQLREGARFSGVDVVARNASGGLGDEPTFTSGHVNS